jgi:hypothetical protein
MDRLREYRYTIPGVFAAAILLLGLPSELSLLSDPKGVAAAAGILAAALLSFVAGYPFAVVADFLSCVLRPRIPSQFDYPMSRHTVATERQKRMLISVLHHTLLPDHTVQFLTRRLNNFYVAVNSLIAIWGTVIGVSLWRWTFPYSCKLMSILVLFTIALVLHARKQFMEHHELNRLFVPLMEDEYRRRKRQEEV